MSGLRRAVPGDAPVLTDLRAIMLDRVVSRTAAPVPGRGRVPTGEVVNVVTRAEARGRGHARACVTAVLAWMDDAGVARVSLAATPDGEPLYRSLGFTARPWRAMWRQVPPGP